MPQFVWQPGFAGDLLPAGGLQCSPDPLTGQGKGEKKNEGRWDIIPIVISTSRRLWDGCRKLIDAESIDVKKRFYVFFYFGHVFYVFNVFYFVTVFYF